MITSRKNIVLIYMLLAGGIKVLVASLDPDIAQTGRKILFFSYIRAFINTKNFFHCNINADNRKKRVKHYCISTALFQLRGLRPENYAAKYMGHYF